MKTNTVVLFVVFLLSLMLVQRACAGPDFLKAHSTTHTIIMDTIASSGKCSATAIGPHALLTASHCEAPTDELDVDGRSVRIVGVPLRDKQDHSIFLVTDTYKDYATISVKPLAITEDIFIFGNPGGDTDIFRKGYVAGFKGKSVQSALQELLSGADSESVVFLYDLNGFQGDSGSGVFNSSGEVAGVLSFSYVQSSKDIKDPYNIKLMGGWSLAFTAEQLQQALCFFPPIVSAKKSSPVILGLFGKYKKEHHD